MTVAAAVASAAQVAQWFAPVVGVAVALWAGPWLLRQGVGLMLGSWERDAQRRARRGEFVPTDDDLAQWERDRDADRDSWRGV